MWVISHVHHFTVGTQQAPVVAWWLLVMVLGKRRTMFLYVDTRIEFLVFRVRLPEVKMACQRDVLLLNIPQKVNYLCMQNILVFHFAIAISKVLKLCN